MKKPIVLLAAFINNFLGSSLGYSAGIIHFGLLEKFPESASKVALAGALFTSVFCLAGPISTTVINTLSCRSALFIGAFLNFAGFLVSSFSSNIELVVFCYGIISGIGQSMMYSASVLVAGYYFHKNVSVATGVVVSGTGLGVTVFPMFTEFLLRAHGIDGTFLLLSAISLQTCVFTMCIGIHEIERERKSPQKFSTRLKLVVYDLRKLSSNGAFCLLCISILCWSTSLNTSVLFLPDYYKSTGSSELQAASLMSIYGVFNYFSRVITGLAASDDQVDGKILYMGSFVILSMCTALLPMVGTSFAGKVFYSIVLGLYSSGVWSLLTTITIELIGIKQTSTAFGIEMLTSGIGFLSGPVIGNNIKEVSGGYSLVFVISGILYMMAGVFEVFMILTMRKSGVLQSSEEQRRSIEIEDTMIRNGNEELENNKSDEEDERTIEIEERQKLK
ncbi:monocarboxylate transporter 2-like [Saccostrea echinata]|uniref:monocarboxylate transporter 2-like n=1 Tax=Saccostrea echinata TaxID=191078 RepID=UPI002A8395EF|nr:monocarboxylate transporter 2-like [Saccostrea echinata]